jgi:DNA-binding CsgD family transcriptional regulator/GAF domain-containing protein
MTQAQTATDRVASDTPRSWVLRLNGKQDISEFTLLELSNHRVNASRLILDIKRCGELMQRLSGQLEVSPIAACVTEGLVELFDLAFARIWTVNEERTALRLVASSGLYPRLDGSFATVPMGAFKVGKIAQHRIPFLSNCLAEESWVKDRDWAIANQIQGFAGLPLLDQGEAIAVLAVFSQSPLSPERLEVLQLLSIATAGAIAKALAHQRALAQTGVRPGSVLSEQLSDLLGKRLSLLGTETPLSMAVQLLLQSVARQLQGLTEHYCRLIYEPETVSLEVMVAAGPGVRPPPWLGEEFAAIAEGVKRLQGRVEQEQDGTIAKLLVQLPRREHREEQTAPGLSERERQVLEQLAQGGRDREIAEQLYISERTVKFHVKNILAKLGVRTRVQAVYLAMQRGWLT